MSYMTKLKSSTALPVIFGAAGLAMTVAVAVQAAPQPAGGAENPAAQPASRSMLVAAACNPCGARRCNPCAPKGCNPCAGKNPCAAGACNPCNPCAGGGGLLVVAGCVVPSLAASHKCNPCAAKRCNPCAPRGCNPCAAKKCNPCAAKNPCAAGACNPCNPCGAAVGIEVSAADAADAYACVKTQLKAAYGDAGYLSWKSYNKGPYVSGTHGGRYVNNYANRKAFKYGRFEDAGTLAKGSVLAKDSFVVMPDGKVAIGPLFLMEKMGKGFAPNGGDWKYTMIVPGAGTVGVTAGKGSGAVKFCADCHAAVEEQDYLFFLPEEYRKK